MAATGALIRLTLQQALLPRKLLVLALLALPVVTGLLLRLTWDPEEAPITGVAGIIAQIVLGGVVPMLSLLAAHGDLGSDISDGTIVTLLTTPVSRLRIVLVKMFTLGLTIGVLLGLSTLAAGVIVVGGLDPTGLVVALAVAATVGGFLYTQLFLGLTLLTRRDLMIGLLYIMIWEGAMADLFSGLSTFSIRQYLNSVTVALSTVDAEVFSAKLPIGTALWMASGVALTILALWVFRLRGFQVDRAT